MEEADHLADRVGVLAKNMLDIGSTAHLRAKHGHGFHIHLIASSAPNTPVEEMERVGVWIQERLPGAKVEGSPYHGQMRFSIPAGPTPTDNKKGVPSASSPAPGAETADLEIERKEKRLDVGEVSIGALFVLLEENKKELGLEFYSISPSTFDEVFLRVVEKHNVGEEDRPDVKKDWKYYGKKMALLLFMIPA
jgi:hypothetical protein